MPRRRWTSSETTPQRGRGRPAEVDPLPEEPAPARNLVGGTGFVISLVSLFTVGALSPVSLVVSMVGLSWRPRNLAALGTVISLMGCGLMAGVVYTVTVEMNRARMQAEARLQEQARNALARPPREGIEQIDALIDQLHSLSPEERERLRKSLKEGFTTLDELLQETNGVPVGGARPESPLEFTPEPSRSTP